MTHPSPIGDTQTLDRPQTPPEPCLHRLFEAQAARTPLAPAVVCESATLSYAELNVRANRLARHLRGQGIGPGTLVAVCLERSWEMVVALLGVLKAGGAYVPMDPDYPADRLAFMVRDADARLLLTRASLRERLPAQGAPVFCLDTDWERAAREAGDDLPDGARPDDLAYVIYTSGSTGVPKGVQIAHRGVCSNLRWRQETFPLSAQDRLLQTYSFSFDPSVWAFFWPLTVGAQSVLPRPDGHGDSGYLARIIAQERITVLGFSPSMLGTLLDEPGIEHCQSLRHVFSGGEALPGALVRRFHSLLPAELHNVYGPTEATIDATWWTCRRGGEADTVPIGHALPGVQAYLLNEDGHEATEGELCLAGIGLAMGYLNRPELTADKFVPNPFGPGKMYRTGDLARRRADGALEYLGRTDHQVKVRGYRIELGEIEAALLALPAVRDAAVLAREDRPGDQRLAAYVVAWETVTVPELESRLRTTLPTHMIPADWIMLSCLPLSANGKLDRNALPAPDTAQRRPQSITTPPGTETEKRLAALWTQVLAVDDIGLEDHFFDLGGNSLSATRLISRVRAAFGIDLAIRALFEAPTLAGFAARVESAPRRGRQQTEDPLPCAARDGTSPPSFSQQRLWFFEQWQPGTAVYNIPLGLRLTGRLDLSAVSGSLNEIVRRHEALRTILQGRSGQPFPQILPPSAVSLPVVDLTMIPAVDREAEAQRQAVAEAQRPFDLAQDLMLRARLLRLDSEEHRLVLTLHHIASDGWSVGLLLEEFAAIYEALAAGRPIPLAELPAQYADWAAWQRDWVSGQVQQTQTEFWRQALAGAPTALELPTDRQRPARQTFQGARLPASLPATTGNGLRSLARAEGASLFMTLAGGLQATLARWSGQHDIIIGTPVAGRDRVETEALIGYFVNTLALRADLSGDPTGREFVGRVREAALGAFSHADLPFEQIVDALQPQRDPSRHPYFQTLFALQNAPQASGQIGGLCVEPFDIDNGTAKFDLTLNLWEDADEGLSGWWEYNTALFDAATVARLSGHLATLLAGLAGDPDLPLSRLPLLTESERHQILEDWNQTEVEYPTGETVHQMFAAQAARTPDAIAATYDGRSLTYAQLDARADRLANFLRSRGVGPDTLVGLCVERSLEMVVGLLGILKAGGAYVPLDPGYPSERLTFMLADTACPLLLTQAHLCEALPQSDAEVVRLDADWERIASHPDTEPTAQAGPENLAYVIYTSGSTGRPKGAMLEHRGVTNYLHYCLDTYGLEAGGGSLVHSSFAFDLTVTSLIAPLVAGRAVHLLPPGNDVEALAGAIRSGHDLTLLKLTPAHLSLLAQQIAPNEAAGRARAFVVGGENLTGEHIDFWTRHAPGTAIFNEYGPTETVVGCCVHHVTADQPLTASVPIGRPIANTRLYVLDDARQPVPVGVAGELYVAGVQVGRGYLNRPELTAERFLPDPFGPGKMYRTGDLCRLRADGCLEYLGRIDHQVKVRGYRIELGEIEAALLALPTVKDAAVLAREDTPGDQRLAAYIVAEQGRALSTAELRATLAKTLPGYMVPTLFTALPALPLTPNGKTDRSALLARQPDAPGEKADSRDSPADALEASILQVWEELLPGAQIGVRDDFFEVGGHSLLAVRMMHRLEQISGQKISLATLFQEATVAHLARVLRGAARTEVTAKTTGPMVAFHTQGTAPPFFFLHGDYGGGFFCANLAQQLGPDQPLYVLPPHGVDGGEIPPTIEEMARDYIPLLRAIQPQGPYLLGGFCNGGLVAYEMAHQLQAAGEEIRLLALVDVESINTHTKKLLHSFVSLTARLRKMPPDARLQAFVRLQERVLPWDVALKRRWRALGRVFRRPSRTEPASDDTDAMAREIQEQYFGVLARYVTRRYPSRITLILSREGWEMAHGDPISAWREVAEEMEYYDVPGSHFDCLTTHAPVLADRLRACLKKSTRAE